MPASGCGHADSVDRLHDRCDFPAFVMARAAEHWTSKTAPSQSQEKLGQARLRLAA